MHLAPIDTIVVRSGRYRRNIDEAQVKELAESIAGEAGLLHLPVVREVNGTLELVAGERRMRAMQALWKEGRTFHHMGEVVPQGMFPFSLIGEMNDLAAREAEVEENVRRVDLSWQDRVLAIAELHELRKLQDPTHTIAKTAEEVGCARTPASDALILAKHLDDPDIRSAPSPQLAMRRLAYKFETELRRAAGSVAQQTKHTLLCGDAVELIRTLPTETFDVILTDPPYGIGATNFDAHIVVQHTYSDSWSDVSKLLAAFLAESFRVARRQAHLYVFCDMLRFLDLRDMAAAAGWAVWPRPLIWVKDVGHIANANLGPRHQYECILFANKGNKLVMSIQSDVISVPTVSTKRHAAEKPVELYRNLLRRSVIPGDKVLDPFCGSGTIFEAAEAESCIATGFDSDAACIDIARERMEAL